MIDKKQVKDIAKLAMLQLTEEEVEKFKKDFSEILDYIEQLKELDLENVKETSHPFESENVLREDNPEKFEETESLVEAACDKKDKYIKVKSVF